MNDEAAESRGPSTPGAGPQGAPAPSAPSEPATAPQAPAADDTATDPSGYEAPDADATRPGTPPPPPPGPGVPPHGTPPYSTSPPGTPPHGTPPHGAPPYGANVPPWLASAGAAFTRQQLVRPRHGRYVAGVCGALARATNTDPVLWRVLLAVLGILGGTGVLLYLIGWLIIPSEGDTASPIESLLGKGQSGMAPLSVVLLGGAALLTFAFIVNSGARASMLAAAVILGAFLLIKRGGSPGRDAFSGAATASAAPPPPPTAAPHAEEPTLAFTTAPAAAPATEPVTKLPPRYEPPQFTPSQYTAPQYTAPQFAPPTEGVRPPFAPHGPYVSAPLPPKPPAQPKAPKPPKPPRERSVLGRLTFFAVVVVMGLLAVLDMAGVNVVVSAYFAAALATIGLGLIVGTWFGRARGLIALALVATMGLVVSTGTERWGGEFRDSVYRPANLAEVADRYDFTFGNVTMDLRDVDFAGADQVTTVSMKVGQLRVLLPPEVDTTVDVSVGGGRTVIFGQEWNSSESENRSVTDLGTEGTGGGSLRLDLRLDTGNLEVTR